MATLREYFDTDFTRVLNSAHRIGVNTGAGVVQVDVRVHFDFDANAKYLSCYLTPEASTAAACEGLITNLGQLLAVAEGVEVRTGFTGEVHVGSGDLQFAGRVYLYHEGALDDSWKQQFTLGARSRDIFVRLRGPSFAFERTKLQKPLAFISHDSRDKDQIARPIAVGLSKL